MRGAELVHLLKLEAALDLRQRAAWGGMVLYVASAIYTCHLAMQDGASGSAWSALFWIILLFAAFNALARSFQREDGGRQLYLHTLAHPRSVVLARTAYNAVTMLVLSLLSLLFYAVFLGDEPLRAGDPLQFTVAVALGGIGFASVLTLISAIAARAGSGIGLMAILGFPIVLPMLLAVMQASRLALSGAPWGTTAPYFLGILLIDVVALSLAWLLFPYLWRD